MFMVIGAIFQNSPVWGNVQEPVATASVETQTTVAQCDPCNPCPPACDPCPPSCEPCQPMYCDPCPPASCEPCNPCSQQTYCPPPCDPCDPCAPVCRVNSGISLCAIGLALLAIGGAAAIVVTSNNGGSEVTGG